MGGRRRPQGVGKGGRHHRLLTRSAGRGRGAWDERLNGPESVARGGDAGGRVAPEKPRARCGRSAAPYAPTRYIVRSPSAVITFA